MFSDGWSDTLLWSSLWILGSLRETQPRPYFQRSATETGVGLQTRWSSRRPCRVSEGGRTEEQLRQLVTYEWAVAVQNIITVSRVHHDVCRLGVWRVDSDVVRLDSNLHCWRSVDENPAGVVGVGCCRIFKGPGWWEQLNVTICGVKIWYLW